MRIKAPTVMLLAFGGIVAYLLITSSKNNPSQTTGPVLPTGGAGTNPYQGSSTPTAANPTGLSGTTQGGASGAGGASDFNNALSGAMDGAAAGGGTGGTGNAGA